MLFLFFLYFRIIPIHNQTVAYTFDQGRDFLKAAEIIETKRLTFIGPTTGIMGLFHGSWWYYFLIFPYLLFRGTPQGFYYTVLGIHFIALIFFTLFIHKKVGFLPTLLFLSIVSVSPYFTKISIFAGNNTLTPIAVLFLLFALYQFFQTKKNLYVFLTALSLSFVLETELSFGVILIPSFLVIAGIFSETRSILKHVRSIVFFLCGIVLASIPRMLFELKNHFLQTKTLIQFFNNPTVTNPQSFQGAIIDRFRFFQSYFLGIFYDYSKTIALLFFLAAFFSLMFFWKKYKKHDKNIVLFLISLVFAIFVLSLTNRNNFFWENYLEGLQYIFLFVVILALSILQKIKTYFFILYGFVGFFVFLNVMQFGSAITNTREPPSIGLRADMKTVFYLYEQNKNIPFCVRIYTPPVIPYTYTYLFSYYSSFGYIEPSEGFINNRCWYIFDKESYEFRVKKWRKEHIPEKAVLRKKVMMKNETAIELWEES